MQSYTELIERLVDKQASGSFLGVDDIVDILLAYGETHGEVLFVARVDGKVITNLSCHVTNDGEAIIFSNQAELERTIHSVKREGLVQSSFKQSSVFVASSITDIENNASIDYLKRLLLFVFRNTFHNENLIGDRISISEKAAANLANRHFDPLQGNRVETFLNTLAKVDGDFKTADIVFGGVRLRKFRSHRGTFDSELLDNYRTRLGVLGCINSGNPAIQKTENQNLLLLPMRSSVRESIFENSALAIPLGENLSYERIKRLEGIANAFQRQYKISFRTSVISNLESALSSGFQVSLPRFDWEYIDQFLVGALDSIAEEFLFATNSHSFVFRSYEAFSRSLTPRFDLHVGEAGKRNTAEAKIKLSDDNKSCNAFTFMHCSPSEGAIYIPDVTNIPEELKRRGLNTISHWRQSRSEITAPIFFKDTPIGTLNIESEFPSNFDNEFSLVVQIVRIISRHLEALIERYDSRWIGDVAQSRAAIHEARQITFAELQSPDIRPLQADNRGAVLDLHSLIEASLQYKEGSEHETLSTVIDSELNRTPKHLKWSRRAPWINIPDIETLDMSYNAHIAYVLREQIRNYYRSRDPQSRLRIIFHQTQRVGQISGFLYVETLLSKRLGKSIQSKFALLPLRFDGRLHYGMYLAGILTRASGGWVHVEEKEQSDDPLIAVTIRLPVLEN